MRFALPFLLLLAAAASAQDKPLDAAGLIMGVKAAKPSGGIYLRLRMEHRGGAGGKQTLQVQVKRRDTADGAIEQLYQVQFPQDRKGEGLLLRTKGGSFSGATYTPGQGVRRLEPGDRAMGIFGTALTIQDAMAPFLDWPSHATVGHEKLGAVNCAIIESTPGIKVSTGVRKVKSWIDESRYVAMRIEIYGAGEDPVKSVETNRVARLGSGYYTPISFTVTDQASGAETTVEGVRSASDIAYTDADFTEAALQTLTAPAVK